jgi:cell division protein YceG involved in septum cleavage
MMRRLLPWIGLMVVLLIGVTVAAVATWIMSPLVPPSQSSPPPVRTIEIPERATFRQVAALLQQQQLIASRWGFLLLGRLTCFERGRLCSIP